LQTDGYKGYNEVCKDDGIIHVGCFAHARRYFHDAFKLNKKSEIVKKGINYIQKIYKIEKTLRGENLFPDKFIEKRKKQALPILDDFHMWLNEKINLVAPESKTGKALQYTLNEWEKLIKYLDASFITPDNNAAERAIRPFVIGRKNWLFSNTPRGAHASAAIYSLVESAKANNLEPYRYLRYLFTHLPEASSKDELKQLLPNHIQSDLIKLD